MFMLISIMIPLVFIIYIYIYIFLSISLYIYIYIYILKTSVYHSRQNSSTSGTRTGTARWGRLDIRQADASSWAPWPCSCCGVRARRHSFWPGPPDARRPRI